MNTTKLFAATAAITVALPMVASATQIERDANAQILLQEGRTVLVYRQDGSFTVTEPGTVELLLVGGGGGGGTLYYNQGCGGGGGGGVVTTNAVTLQAGTYSVSIGAGGATGVTDRSNAQNGGNTVLAFGGSPLFTAYGGGAGGCAYRDSSAKGAGHNGASGGGGQRDAESDTVKSGGIAVHAGDGNIGNNGGSSSANQWGAGGGGGAGAPGASGNDSAPGAGGDGVEVRIIGAGDNFWYGGGGAGRRYDNNRPASGGKGGGGASGEPGENGRGGGGSGGCNGGSGILVIAFARTSEPAIKDGWFECVGGDETLTINTENGNEEVRIFRNSGTLTVTRGSGTMEVLAVGGGGGGGATNSNGNASGGGGGGGVVHYTNLKVSAGTYAIEIGAGGGVSTNGFQTSGLGIVAYGGGAGGNAGKNGDAKDGASGGGAGHNASNGAASSGGTAIFSPYLNKGFGGASTTHSYGAGGGGGAGAPGEAPNGSKPGNGGDGYLCDITGMAQYYGGGGAGFRADSPGLSIKGGEGGGGSVGGPGEAGKGGGGAGGAHGGSGIFIVRYALKPVATVISMR